MTIVRKTWPSLSRVLEMVVETVVSRQMSCKIDVFLESRYGERARKRMIDDRVRVLIRVTGGFSCGDRTCVREKTEYGVVECRKNVISGRRFYLCTIDSTSPTVCVNSPVCL